MDNLRTFKLKKNHTQSLENKLLKGQFTWSTQALLL